MKTKVLLLMSVIILTMIACKKEKKQPVPPPVNSAWVDTKFSATGSAHGISVLFITAGGRFLAGVSIDPGSKSLYTSTNKGLNWWVADSLNEANINGTVNAVKQDPSSHLLLAGCFSSQQNGLFTSADDGKTWVNNTTRYSPFDFAFFNGKTYMAAHDGIGPETYQESIISSTDNFVSNNASCGPFRVPITANMRMFVFNNQLFLCTYGMSGLYKAVDITNGIFTHSDVGLLTGDFDTDTDYTISLAAKGNYLFAASTRGVFRSINGGERWTLCDLGFTAVPNQFAVIGSDIYVGLQDKGVYKSTDNGVTWASFNKSLPLPRTVRCLAVSGTTLFEGDADSKIYKIDTK